MPKNSKNAYLFISPYFILFFAFFAFAIGYALIVSFTNMGPGGGTEFVGLKNYARLLGDPLFWNGLKVVSTVLFIQMPIMTGLALILALLVNSPLLKGGGVFRTILVLPMLTSLVVAGLLWYPMLGEQYGLFNTALGDIGLPTFSWLLDSKLALFSVHNAITWRWTGYNMIIFLAGLQAIPKELYDAASLDAGRLQMIRHITLPLLKPMIIFSVIFSIIGSLQTFAIPLVLTGGGPGFATKTVMMRIYDLAFGQGQFGYAAAMAMVLAAIALCGAFFLIRRLGYFVEGE